MSKRMNGRARLAVVSLLSIAAAACSSTALAGSCSVSSTGMAFGAYEPLTFAGKLLSADRTSMATVSLACTAIGAGGSYSIALGPSPQDNATFPRYLSHDAGGPSMAFNIYLDAGYSVVWADAFTGSVLSGSIPAGDSSRNHTVFGRVPGGQNQLRAGSYSTTLTMTVTFNP